MGIIQQNTWNYQRFTIKLENFRWPIVAFLFFVQYRMIRSFGSGKPFKGLSIQCWVMNPHQFIYDPEKLATTARISKIFTSSKTLIPKGARLYK